MHAQNTETFRHVAAEKLASVSRSGWNWNRIRTIGFWASTFVVVFELAAGSVWNFMQIEWVRVQLDHLGYPPYFVYINGASQVGAAAAIIAPRFPRLKEWAYAGAFFHFSGALASHLLAGDVVDVWLPPLLFLIFVIVSWALRPADRRLPDAAVAPETRPLAWAVPVGILVLLYIVSYLTLPAVNTLFHERAIELGWIPR
jgi:DoxX-like family